MRDLNLLETIKLWYPHPYRQVYNRCWGCGKRRFFGEWWEGYQMDEEGPNHWGFFCAPCIIIVTGMVNDRLHEKALKAVVVRYNAITEVLDLFDVEKNWTVAQYYDAVCALHDHAEMEKATDELARGY